MSNITWNYIRDTIKAIFDDKDIVAQVYYEYYGIDFSNGNKMILTYNDIGFTGFIGTATLKDDSIELYIGIDNPKRIIPLGEYDELEFVLINGRPSKLEIDFIEILKQFLDPDYDVKKDFHE